MANPSYQIYCSGIPRDAYSKGTNLVSKANKNYSPKKNNGYIAYKIVDTNRFHKPYFRKHNSHHNSEPC